MTRRTPPSTTTVAAIAMTRTEARDQWESGRTRTPRQGASAGGTASVHHIRLRPLITARTVKTPIVRRSSTRARFQPRAIAAMTPIVANANKIPASPCCQIGRHSSISPERSVHDEARDIRVGREPPRGHAAGDQDARRHQHQAPVTWARVDEIGYEGHRTATATRRTSRAHSPTRARPLGSTTPRSDGRACVPARRLQ